MYIERGINKVVPKPSPFGTGPLASIVSRYGLWASAAASTGVVTGAGFFSDEVPVSVILVALFGLGIWLADVNKRNQCGQGLIADTLFGVFISAVIIEWSYILAMVAGGHFDLVKSMLSALSP